VSKYGIEASLVLLFLSLSEFGYET
jgi:hypothetical protein